VHKPVFTNNDILQNTTQHTTSLQCCPITRQTDRRCRYLSVYRLCNIALSDTTGYVFVFVGNIHHHHHYHHHHHHHLVLPFLLKKRSRVHYKCQKIMAISAVKSQDKQMHFNFLSDFFKKLRLSAGYISCHEIFRINPSAMAVQSQD